MNTETTEKKRPIRTAAMFVGTIAIVILIAWLSIRIVNNVPGSFASLASLAETVNTYDSAQQNHTVSTQNMLIVTSDVNVVPTGEQVRLSWTESRTPGSYVFSYECTDGVAIDIANTDGERNISCGTNYNLGNTNNVTLTINSEKGRYVDIPYTLSFLGTNDTEPQATDHAIVTVVNSNVAQVVDEVTDTETTTPEVTDTPTPETPAVETSATPVTTPAAEPTYTQEYTYTIPVSDPNGRIDLAVKYLNVGRIVNNAFVAQIIDNDFSGAIQFEVKNLGTKTSDTWTYSVSLPSGGTFESEEQAALKPNERAVITIGFPESSVISHTFEVSIDSTGDNTSVNDTFKKTIVFID